MKIQVTQTLPNGQVLQQVLSKEGGEALKVQVQPGAKVSFNMEGTKPTEGGNAKAKTGSVKKVGNNLVLEAEGEALVEVTDFYSTPGASVGDLGWNYVASDAAVTAATPEAQALAADAAATESGALLPAIAPGWLAVGGAAAVAAAGSNGGSDAAKVVGAVLVIGLALGPLTDAGSGTTVKVYKANGTELAGSGSWVDGKFVFTPTEAYSGKVFIRVIDGDAAPDYMDEATGAGKNMGSDLWAATEVGSGASSVPITVTPITTIAALKAVGATSVTDMSTKVTSGNGANADITNTNKAIATLFGLSTSEDLAQQTPEMAITSAGTSSTPNTYGKALAVISKVDVTTGSFAQTIDQLVAATTVTGATASFAGSSVVTALAAAATSTTVANVILNSAEIQASAAAAPADSTVPVFTSAAVSADGLTLTLTYGEALDATNVPVANDFVVNVAGSPRTVDSLSVSGSTVVLTLASAVYASEVVTVGYTDPSANNDSAAIQDASGNDAATITGQSVTNSSTVTVLDQPGTIAVTGTATQGETLTAGTPVDADGSISGITYQWKSDGNAINGATSSTYVLTQGDVGKAITVVATYTDGHGSGKTVTSTATSSVANIDDAGTIAVTGTATQGETLTAGTPTDADGGVTGVTYQWKSDGAAINGATSSTYVLTQSEVGKAITVVATYTDGHGSGKTVTSTATGAVVNIDDAGTIAVTGTATQGETLTAGTPADADGGVSGVTYQWKSDGNDINGATSSTYVLTQSEVGKAITVVATYTDGHGSGKTVTSTATGAVVNIDDAGTIAVTGTATQGETLTAGTPADADGGVSGVTYQWKSDGNAINGATSSTYTLTQGDVGKAITVVATYTDGHGSGKTVASTATSSVANIDDAGSIAAISGTVEQGQTLTAGDVTDPDGNISGITYQWKSDGNAINGATSSTYVLTQGDVGKAITVVATYTDGHGSGKTVTSTATSSVANIDDAGSIAAISGTVEQGQTLTAGDVTDPDGNISGITYQWKSDGNAINGATSSTYVLTQGDVGKAITVVATYTDGHGSGKTVTSAETAAVLDTTAPQLLSLGYTNPETLIGHALNDLKEPGPNAVIGANVGYTLEGKQEADRFTSTDSEGGNAFVGMGTGGLGGNVFTSQFFVRQPTDVTAMTKFEFHLVGQTTGQRAVLVYTFATGLAELVSINGNHQISHAVQAFGDGYKITLTANYENPETAVLSEWSAKSGGSLDISDQVFYMGSAKEDTYVIDKTTVEAGATVQRKIAGGEWVNVTADENGDYKFQVPLTVNGSEVQVRQVDAAGNPSTVATFDHTAGVVAPILLDFNRDGQIDYVTDKSQDMDGDGTADTTAWVGNFDAVLFADKNIDGVANAGEWAFGDLSKGLTDLQGLALLDDNADGLINLSDSVWSSLKVWQDTNGDGVSTGNEVLSLTQVGIASIELKRNDQAAHKPVEGVQVYGSAWANMVDGSQMLIHDAAFAYTQQQPVL